MACNSCNKTFSLLRREKGCPSCGFSYCSNCLKYKIFVPKLNFETKVCMKCERSAKNKETTRVEPPDVYYKRINTTDNGAKHNINNNLSNDFNINPGTSTDQEISDRLQKLKDGIKVNQVTTEDIANRLQKIKGDLPSTSDVELQKRLANLKGVPISTLKNKALPVVSDSRTEQEQVEDLMKQYIDQTKIDGKYEEEFQGVIDNIQTRLHKLKNTEKPGILESKVPDLNIESESEEELLNKIVEKAKAESRIENEVDIELQELPFCEICNEDANMRCLGCKYLFCKRCFIEHKDEDDGCDKYETYRPLKDCN